MLTGSGVTVLVASISVTLVTCGLGGVASGATLRRRLPHHQPPNCLRHLPIRGGRRARRQIDGRTTLRSRHPARPRSRGASARDATTAYIGFARAGRIPLSITPAALNRGGASLPAPCYRFPQRRCSAAITAHVVVQRDYSFVCHRMRPSGVHRETITPDPPYWGLRRSVPIRFV